MSKIHHLGTLGLLLVALVCTGCPDAKQAVVFNGSSNDISLADLASGDVTPDLGGMTIGPVANHAVVRGTTAYVVNSGAYPGSTGANVQVIDLVANTVTNTIPFPDGDNPWAIVPLSDTKAYVTCVYGNNVTVIDPTLPGASAILDTIALPSISGVPVGPEGIVVLDGYAYTANTGYDAATYGYVTGSVSVIDTATNTLVDADGDAGNGTDTPILLSGLNPQDLAVDAEGQINVVCTGDYWSTWGALEVIDPATWTVTASLPVGGSPGNIATGNDFAILGAGDADSCDLYVVRTDLDLVLMDSSNPWTLLLTSGWCTVGKPVFSDSGEWAYVAAGAWGAENMLFELSVTKRNQKMSKYFDLAPEANLPVAVGLLY